MNARVLFLDVSGKPDVGHASGAVVVAGFSVAAEDYATLSRRILGATGRFYAKRGQPQDWEIKSASVIKPNPWKRANNRGFCRETARLLATANATIYSATLDKAKMKHSMELRVTMPLQLQILIEHFDVECRALNATGIVVADWSSHHLDQHASRCVASFVASRKLSVHPCVYYASSHASEGVQLADLIAGVRRRAHEGDANLISLDVSLSAIRAFAPADATTKQGRPFQNRISVF